MRFNLLKNSIFHDDDNDIKDVVTFNKKVVAPSGYGMIFKDAFIWRLADI